MPRRILCLLPLLAACATPPKPKPAAGGPPPTRAASPFSVKPPPEAAPQHRYAVVVGVNRYPDPKLNDLKAAVRDAKLFGVTLRDHFGFLPKNVRVLTDAQATRANLIGALQWLETKAGPDRSVVFYFAGHGSRTRDESGDETDGYDETLVPYDAHRDPSRAPMDLPDDLLGAMVRRIAAKGGGVTVVLDACHSGTGTKGGDVARSAVPFEAPADGELPRGADLDGLRYVSVAGAADDQQAVERPVKHPGGRVGPYHGLFTWHLVQALKAAGPGETWAQVVQRVRAGMRTAKVTQTLQLEGPGGALRPFALIEPLPPASVDVDRTGTTRPDGRPVLRLPVGRAHGFGVGSEFTVFPLGADLKDPAQAVGRLRLKRVEPHGSEGALFEGKDPPEHGRAVVHRRVPVTPPLTVWLGGEPVPEAWTRSGAVKAAQAEPGADLRVRRLPNGAVTVQGPVGPAVELAEPELAQRVEDWATWKIARSLVAPPPPDLPVTFEAVRPDGAQGPYRQGERVDLTVRSAAGHRLYLHLVSLDDLGQVQVFYPRQQGTHPHLRAFRSWSYPVRLSVAGDRPEGMNWIRLVATTEPTDLHFMNTSGKGDWALPAGRMLILDLALPTVR